ncbi:MAG: outer membrane protein assembly factor [Spirochaetales bacterium]
MGRLKRISTLFAILLLATIGLFAQRRGRPSEIEIRFLGNDSVEADELRDLINREVRALSEGGAVSDLIDAVFTIQDWYRGEGFPDAEVQVRLLNTDDEGELEIVTDTERYGTVDRVEFVIREGRRFYLGEIAFRGNESFSDETLSEYVPRTGRLLLGAGRALYRPSEIEKVVESVSRHYRLEGYLRVEVIVASQDRIGDEVDVVIEIDEGVPYAVSAAQIAGRDTLPSDVRQEAAAERPDTGQRFTERLAADGADRIERVLGRSGFLTDVRYEVVSNQEDATVSIVYEFDPVPRSILTDIEVRGAGDEPLRTREQFVRQQFELPLGEPVNRLAVEEGRQRLYETGLFRLVSVNFQPRVESERFQDEALGRTEEVDLIVEIVEDRNRSASISLGYSSVLLLLGSAEYLDQNLFGLGRTWGVELQGSFAGYRAQTRIADPLLLGRGGLMALELSHALRLRDAFTERSYAADISASLPLTEQLRTFADYRFEIVDIRDTGEEADDEVVRIGRAELGALWNTVDSLLSPMSGTAIRAVFGVSGGPLGSELNYTSYEATITRHFQVNDFITLTVEADSETIYPGADTEIPISQRLYAGGASSVRSFPQDALSPVGSDGTAVGGLSRIEGTVELRIGIIGNLALAVFADAGSVSREPFAAGDVGYGAGAGLRYNLPVGPLRLDFAVNPGPTFAAERSWAIHFSVGSGF